MPPRALAAFLPAWQDAGHTVRAGAAPAGPARRAGPDAVYEVIEQLAGAALPASALETLVLPGRVPGYEPAMLDELTVAGDVVWSGRRRPARWRWLGDARPGQHRGAAVPAARRHHHDPAARGHPHGPGRGRGAVLPGAGRPGGLLPGRRGPGDGAWPRPSGTWSARLCGGTLARCHGAEPGGRAGHGRRPPRPVTAGGAAIWDLVWAGLLTNDTLARAAHRAQHRPVRAAGPAAPAAAAARCRGAAGGRMGARRPGLGRAALPVPGRAPHGDRPLVAAAAGRTGPDPAAARAGPCPAGPARHPDPRRRGRGARARRVRRPVPGAAGHGGNRPVPPRLLRRGPGRGPVRAARRGGPDAGDGPADAPREPW